MMGILQPLKVQYFLAHTFKDFFWSLCWISLLLVISYSTCHGQGEKIIPFLFPASFLFKLFS